MSTETDMEETIAEDNANWGAEISMIHSVNPENLLRLILFL